MAEKCGDEDARLAWPGPPHLQSQGKMPWRRVCNIYYLEQDLLTRSSQADQEACDIKLTYCFCCVTGLDIPLEVHPTF